MAESPIIVRSAPGIKRDGTMFDSDAYVDGQWVRFQRGMPRKIGGYRRISDGATGIVRQIYTQARGGSVYTHIGHSDGVQSFTIDSSGNASATTSRNPAGFVSNANYGWTLDAMRDSAGSGEMLVFAHPNLSLVDISDSTEYPVYYGDIYGTDPLLSTGQSVSGGCVVLHPFLFTFGNDGVVAWSDTGDPTNFTTGDSGNATIDSSKIVKALPLRGGGQSPAGLFWSLNSLIRASYTGGADVFRFDTITAATSILAPNSAIEYDGIYYWCGLDSFVSYNGVVQDVPNTLNSNFFFDNLNYAHAVKVFAFKVPRFGEIWWCFPKGTATECNHAVIFNVRENTWYDTPLPEGGRSAGIYAQVFRSPILAGVQQVELPDSMVRVTEADVERVTEADETRITDNGFTSYKLWRHEIGTDAIDGISVSAIRSYFETAYISLLTTQQPANASLRITAVEPDFVQSGEMTVQVKGYINTKASDVDGEINAFPAVAATPAEQIVKLKTARRLLRLRFESNTVGGDYQMGKTLAHVGPADERMQS